MSDRIKERANGGSSSSSPPNKWQAAMDAHRKGSLSWADCGPEDLVAAVAHVTEDGAAVLLSKTSDGGALMVQVLVGVGDRPKFYAASMMELNELLEALTNV
jgi:hypothetical protein